MLDNLNGSTGIPHRNPTNFLAGVRFKDLINVAGGLCPAYVRFAVAEPEPFRLMFGRSGVETSDIEAELVSGRSPYEILLECLVELEAAGKSELPAPRATLGAWSAVHGLAHLAIEGRLEDVELGIREVTKSVLRSLRD